MNHQSKAISQPILHVIMPVGSDPDHKAKQVAIESGAKRAGFHPRFPDYELDNPDFTPEAFSKQLQAASLILADVTGERPSCYFEIGFAEALGLPVILVAEDGTEVHQSAFRDLLRKYRDVADLEHVVFEALAAPLQRKTG
jgi:nucleoside 2-deoxyribosyltransferase